MFFFFGFPVVSSAQLTSLLVKTVVIDPGHGGKDPGAVGKNSKEKEIVLSVAKKLGNIMQENLSDINIIYTRKTDKFISLNKRAEIANNNNADLFISIHCNSAGSSRAYGAETFVMGLHKTEENLAVAKKENASILLETDYHNEYEGFNPNSDEDYIALSLFQGAFMEQSLTIANNIQTRFISDMKRRDRGVKPAGFWVLYKTTAPGVLIELGFISNAKEEAYLLSEKGQNEMALAIYRAFCDYKKDFETLNQQAAPIAISTEPEEAIAVKELLQIPDNSEKLFYVQLYSSKKLQKVEDFPAILNPFYKKSKRVYKYYSGVYKTLKQASETKKSLRKKGFKNAFVVAFLNGEKVSIK